MDKELIAKRLKEAEQQRKQESEFDQYQHQANIQPEAESHQREKGHISKKMTDSPSHHENRQIFHKEHHKPIESVIKNIEKKKSEKEYEILTPSFK
ncbi:UNKNOWN [Stylonychia lemnae]|uniref:Uncharacterized protein n=1 Tax=Stylonychia lemnae TaxID=5949 RepID=A0A078AEG1_STYLE|nr:UNKNOWN [Stylonychia lemnae]|eukprot:CDW80226.1 UNKNOWN [Stylonychia lemnae]